MLQRLSRPDRYLARCGRLDCAVVERFIDGAPEFMRGLRALFVSDVHVLRRTTQADLDALTDRIAAVAPELLLLGGDYSDSMEGAVRFFRALGRVRPPLGSFGVIGNNDAEAWEGRLEELRERMAEAGCEMLVNGSVRLERHGGSLWVAGVDEHLHGNPSAVGLYPDRPQPGVFRLLLSHYPHMSEPAPDLMLSGHTHGGQFNLLGLTPFAIGFERLSGKKPSPIAIEGFHRVGETRVFISKGIGASRLQLRAGVRPEIDLLIFR